MARCESLLEKAHYYDAAREFTPAGLQSLPVRCPAVCNRHRRRPGHHGSRQSRGARRCGPSRSGLNITSRPSRVPNPYITPELCFQFHYFALRKLHFLLRAQALVVFPGGFGTIDELFDALTLRQTQRMQEIPIILYGREYWERVLDFQFLADRARSRTRISN